MDNFDKLGVKIPPFNKNEARDKLDPENKKILTQLGMLVRGVGKSIDDYRFDKAAERLYEFIWHTFADKYVEQSKNKLRQNDREKLSVLIYVYTTCLKLLHPFMPFITEEINRQLLIDGKTCPLIISSWPG